MLATAVDSARPARLLATTARCRLNPAVEHDAVTERHPVRLAAWLVFVAGFLTLSYASRAVNADTPDDFAYRWSSSVGAAVQFVLVLGILLLVAIGAPKRELFALRQPASWKRALGLVALGLGTIYSVMITYGLVLSLFGDWNATEEQGYVPDGWDSSRAAPLIAFFLAVTILAPVAEELTYRGLGMSLLLPYGTALAVLMTAVLFGGAHGLLVGLPVLVVFGAVNALLRLHTNSVYPPMLLHGVFNAVAMTVAVAGG
jgi:membrane protease YdiL (CAAX protease family)